jgi:hypothetical protein
MEVDLKAPEPESTDVLVAIVERLVDDERSRGATLTTRASTLAGFSGTILAVVATLGREAFKLELGSVGDPALRVMFVASVVALATAASLAVGVLRAQTRELVNVAVVRAFAGQPWIRKEPARIQQDWLASLGMTLERDRSNNDRRAKAGEAAGIVLLVGILCVAGQALVLGIDELLSL